MSNPFRSNRLVDLQAGHAARFREGVALFNGGAYWEAHEAWEEVWKAIPGEERRFFQGLIHAAAAFHQWRRGRLAGAAEHFRRAATKLAPFPSPCMGIDLEALRERLPEWERKAGEGAPFPEPPRLD